MKTRKCIVCGEPFEVDRGYSNGARDRGRRTCSKKCRYAAIAKKQKGKPKAWMHDQEKLEKARPKWSDEGKRRMKEGDIRLFEPEIREKALSNSVEEMKTNPRRGRFETNIHAVEWHLVDPTGRAWSFMNLRHFIREHRELFSHRQLEPIGHCDSRAEACLYHLSPRCSQRSMTALGGWTWNEEVSMQK